MSAAQTVIKIQTFQHRPSRAASGAFKAKVRESRRNTRQAVRGSAKSIELLKGSEQPCDSQRPHHHLTIFNKCIQGMCAFVPRDVLMLDAGPSSTCAVQPLQPTQPQQDLNQHRLYRSRILHSMDPDRGEPLGAQRSRSRRARSSPCPPPAPSPALACGWVAASCFSASEMFSVKHLDVLFPLLPPSPCSCSRHLLQAWAN